MRGSGRTEPQEKSRGRTEAQISDYEHKPGAPQDVRKWNHAEMESYGSTD